MELVIDKIQELMAKKGVVSVPDLLHKDCDVLKRVAKESPEVRGHKCIPWQQEEERYRALLRNSKTYGYRRLYNGESKF